MWYAWKIKKVKVEKVNDSLKIYYHPVSAGSFSLSTFTFLIFYTLHIYHTSLRLSAYYVVSN